MNLSTTGVKRVELAHEVVEKLGTVPDCLGKVTAKGLKCVVDIEECGP